MGGIGVFQALFPERYPERGGDNDEEYYDVEPDEIAEAKNREAKRQVDDQNIPKDVMDEVEKELEEMFKDYPKGMGFCHVYWYHKKEALAKRGYTWMSPQDIADADPHNRIIYD